MSVLCELQYYNYNTNYPQIANGKVNVDNYISTSQPPTKLLEDQDLKHTSLCTYVSAVHILYYVHNHKNITQST